MTEELEQENEALDQEFEALLDQYLPESGPRQEGELVDATVVGIVDDSVLVSYGSKEESPIPVREFLDAKGEPTVKPGDTVRVLLLGFGPEGVPQLSYSKARAAVAAKAIEEALESGRPLRGTITQTVRGGVLVDVGMPAFMPASQVDLYRVPDLNALVGQEIEAYVLEFNQSRGRAVLSRRKLLEERRESGKNEFFDKTGPGETVRGTVRDVLDFGVFVQIGDVEALIPRSELSWERGQHPSEIVEPGQEIEAKVLDLQRETGKVTLSRKRLNQDPWETIQERYPAGTPVRGKVVGIKPFGAFVQLEEGITGLIHASDISWRQDQKSAEEYFRLGDEVTCQVLEIDEQNKRLSLGLKHLTRDPWSDIEEKYPVGSRQKGVVSSLRDFGAFVKLDEYTEGLLHISDLSWTRRYKQPSEALKEGQEIEVVVLKLDRESRRIGLGLKQLDRSPFESFVAENPAGSVVTGKVTRIVSFGAFVEVAEGVEGLIHISQLDDVRVDSPERVVRVGEEVQVKVLSVDHDRERLSLSRKEAFREMEKQNIRQYQRQEKEKEQNIGGSLGDLLNDALKKKK